MAAGKRCSGVRECIQEEMSEILVVARSIVEIIIVENNAEAFGQQIHVDSRIAHNIRVADEQQPPAVGHKALQHVNFVWLPPEERADDDHCTGINKLGAQRVRLIRYFACALQREWIHITEPNACGEAALCQRSSQRLQSGGVYLVEVGEIDHYGAAAQVRLGRSHLPAQRKGCGRRLRRGG